MTMSRRSLIAATALTALAAPRAWPQAPQPEPPPPASTRTPLRTRFAERFTGDFDAMLDPRLIRLVVPDSRTLFFEDTAPRLTAHNFSKDGLTRPSRLAHGR